MDKNSQSVQSAMSKLAVLLGIKPSEAQKAAAFKETVARAKADNYEQLQQLKAEITGLENRALKLKKEFDAAGGSTRRIVETEIASTFEQVDRLRGREDIIVSNLAKVGLVEAKLMELEAAGKRGVTEDQIDDTALTANEAFSAMAEEDRAAKSLESERYKAPERPRTEARERLADLTPQQQALPTALEQRLKELEKEKQ